MGSYCLLPIAYCLPLLGGVRGGFLLPIAYCLLPIAYSLFPVPCSLFPLVYMIEDRQQQRNLSACVQLLAGVKFDDQLIQAYFREDMMQESVVYQRIIRQGLEQGLEQGKRNELNLIIRQISRRLGQINPQLQNQIEELSFGWRI